MKELSPRYNPKDVEEKWLTYWEEHRTFHAEPDPKKRPFTVVIPPPNVTGILHMGHALNNTLQDILVRYKRMKGFEALWMPGTDHAGIATQNVVEKQLAKDGKKRQDLGREEFVKRLWEWKRQYGDTIIRQLKKLGASCDWDRTRFTMDDHYSGVVRDVFIHLYEKGLVYQGQYIINWCPRCQTALSDEEAEHQETNGKLYHIRYPFKKDPDKGVIVATTRPETMLGDTAVAVNPKDSRYKKFVGEILVLPLMNREIKIIADDFVSAEFGTGAVKVTPAHDPNDYAMGKRHHLEFINIMHPDGRLNKNAGPFDGQDRFAGRKAVVEALEKEGLLIKIEDHAHAVGHCYRCDTVVEPYLSKQWFVKMKPLARPALAAVKDGRIKIYPERWEKVYLNWMEEIRDWCISRQIWWGHRIPVWYDDAGNVFVARNEQDAKRKAREKNGKDVPLRQDEDVLDTWFSSWLWPFATLYWPENKKDVAYFYPTDALLTASEIIFFWVARMIMAGFEFMGDIPFKEVYIHGTVRDAKGRKMSKSLGNAIDPLEIIEEYGADALRFSLIINSGQDIFISKEKFEIGRNFANKIWNASRLVLMNIDEARLTEDLAAFDVRTLDLPSRWIVSRLAVTIKKVEEAIESYRYSEAENLVYEFFWGNFCDWYLEIVKGQWSEAQVQKTALVVLDRSLRLMHPFIPFVTEEIFSILHEKEGALSIQGWPRIPAGWVDEAADRDMQTVIDVISAVRNIRVQWNVKPQEEIDGIVVPSDDADRKRLEQAREFIQRLARLRSLAVDPGAKPAKGSATGIAGGIKIFIPLGAVIDLAKETARLNAQIAQQQKSRDGLAGRLENPEFLRKAPEEIVTKEKERLAAMTGQIRELEKTLASLS